MDETSHDEIELHLFALMVSSKGGLDWNTLQNMPLPEVIDLIDCAKKFNQLNKEIEEREAKKAARAH